MQHQAASADAAPKVHEGQRQRVVEQTASRASGRLKPNASARTAIPPGEMRGRRGSAGEKPGRHGAARARGCSARGRGQRAFPKQGEPLPAGTRVSGPS